MYATVIDSFLVIQQIGNIPCSNVIIRMIKYNAGDIFNPYLHPFCFLAGEKKKLNNIDLRIRRHIKVTIMRYSSSILGSQDHIQRITMYCNNDRKMWEKPYLYIQAQLLHKFNVTMIFNPDHICCNGKKIYIKVQVNYKKIKIVDEKSYSNNQIGFLKTIKLKFNLK